MFTVGCETRPFRSKALVRILCKRDRDDKSAQDAREAEHRGLRALFFRDGLQSCYQMTDILISQSTMVCTGECIDLSILDEQISSTQLAMSSTRKLDLKTTIHVSWNDCPLLLHTQPLERHTSIYPIIKTTYLFSSTISTTYLFFSTIRTAYLYLTNYQNNLSGWEIITVLIRVSQKLKGGYY